MENQLGLRRLYGRHQLSVTNPFQIKPDNNRAMRIAKMTRNKNALNRIVVNKTRRNSTSSMNSMASSQSIGSMGSVGTRGSVTKLQPVFISNSSNYKSAANSFRAPSSSINLESFTGINLPEAQQVKIMSTPRPSSPLELNKFSKLTLRTPKTRRGRKNRKANRKTRH
jgi:hypothetical protein